MKILVAILSLYILFLNALPCLDIPKDTGSQKTEHTHDSSTNQEKDQDHCSPFCTCDCCVSPILNNSMTHSICKFVAQNSYLVITNASIATISRTIWQPPKLS